MDLTSLARSEPATEIRPLVLYVGDDRFVFDHLLERLLAIGYLVRIVGTMSAAWQSVVQVSPCAVVIDGTQPSARWRPWELCNDLAACRRFPVIMVLGNGRDDAVNRRKAFEHGADQCFSVGPGLYDDLAAYVAMCQARTFATVEPGTLAVPTGQLAVPRDQSVRIDWETRQVVRGERMVSLSPKEFALLELLASRSGHVVPEREILKALWKKTRTPAARANLKQVVKNLRGKIEIDPQHPQLLVNIRGIGYRMQGDLKDGPGYRDN